MKSKLKVKKTSNQPSKSKNHSEENNNEAQINKGTTNKVEENAISNNVYKRNLNSIKIWKQLPASSKINFQYHESIQSSVPKKIERKTVDYRIC